MKQFICVDGIHYSVDGILAIRVSQLGPDDILPDLITKAIDGVEHFQNLHGPALQIRTIRIERVDLLRFALEFVHAGAEHEIMVPLDEKIIKSIDEARALQQFVVMSIAQSVEPILEMGDIVGRYYGKTVSELLSLSE